MNSNVIGDKNSFAIEWSLLKSNSPYGSVVLWLNGFQIGAKGASEYLYQLKSTLTILVEVKNELLKCYKNYLLLRVKDNEIWDVEEIGEYSIMASECSDDFGSRVFFDGNNFIILWQLVGKNYTYTGIKRRKLYRCEISDEVFTKVAYEFSLMYQDLYNNWDSYVKDLGE